MTLHVVRRTLNLKANERCSLLIPLYTAYCAMATGAQGRGHAVASVRGAVAGCQLNLGGLCPSDTNATDNHYCSVTGTKTAIQLRSTVCTCSGTDIMDII